MAYFYPRDSKTFYKVYHTSISHTSSLFKPVNNICIVWRIFSSQSWERAGCFTILLPYMDSDWSSNLVSWNDLTSLYQLFLPLLVAFINSESGNHHLGSQGNKICTLLPKRIAYIFKWSYGILVTGKVSWMLDAVRDTCDRTGLRCQMWPCKHPVSYGIVVPSNLLYLHLLRYLWKLLRRFWEIWLTLHPCHLGLVSNIWSYKYAY